MNPDIANHSWSVSEKWMFGLVGGDDERSSNWLFSFKVFDDVFLNPFLQLISKEERDGCIYSSILMR
jgi:hypothetical protein